MSTFTDISYDQVLVIRSLSAPCTAKGSSPGLLIKRFRSPSRSPSGNGSSLSKYGDEIVQDSHLLPFSADISACDLVKPAADIRHLTHFLLYTDALCIRDKLSIPHRKCQSSACPPPGISGKRSYVKPQMQ